MAEEQEQRAADTFAGSLATHTAAVFGDNALVRTRTRKSAHAHAGARITARFSRTSFFRVTLAEVGHGEAEPVPSLLRETPVPQPR